MRSCGEKEIEMDMCVEGVDITLCLRWIERGWRKCGGLLRYNLVVGSHVIFVSFF